MVLSVIHSSVSVQHTLVHCPGECQPSELLETVQVVIATRVAIRAQTKTAQADGPLFILAVVKFWTVSHCPHHAGRAVHCQQFKCNSPNNTLPVTCSTGSSALTYPLSSSCHPASPHCSGWRAGCSSADTSISKRTESKAWTGIMRHCANARALCAACTALRQRTFTTMLYCSLGASALQKPFKD